MHVLGGFTKLHEFTWVVSFFQIRAWDLRHEWVTPPVTTLRMPKISGRVFVQAIWKQHPPNPETTPESEPPHFLLIKTQFQCAKNVFDKKNLESNGNNPLHHGFVHFNGQMTLLWQEYRVAVLHYSRENQRIFPTKNTSKAFFPNLFGSLSQALIFYVSKSLDSGSYVANLKGQLICTKNVNTFSKT